MTSQAMLMGIDMGLHSTQELRKWLHEEGYEASLVRFAEAMKPLRREGRVYWDTQKKGWYR